MTGTSLELADEETRTQEEGVETVAIETNEGEKAETVAVEKVEDQNEKEASFDQELLHYHSKWTTVEEAWGHLDSELEQFLTNKEPWEKMADLYSQLDEWREDVEERMDTTVKRGEEIFRLDRNPGPLTEAYKVS